ncbi:hypothetical protein B0J15DRAFT_279077 [Fusarium solani]|uniref:Uncharacterized protein n=1 Tax=Fusarium solani TaxID=169388 RepID=A0A9P9KK62_FUSSL|nr:uncharacterized protein B0J15DRAFT_279077 [Fusarium solani]KAH7260145.1 hypothetical protein B0J15DRAFT_279077 [Fusarium solani]
MPLSVFAKPSQMPCPSKMPTKLPQQMQCNACLPLACLLASLPALLRNRKPRLHSRELSLAPALAASEPFHSSANAIWVGCRLSPQGSCPRKKKANARKICRQKQASKQAVNQSIPPSPRLACMPVQCFECFFSTDGDRKGNNKNKKEEKWVMCQNS